MADLIFLLKNYSHDAKITSLGLAIGMHAFSTVDA